jgi:hypothetical protein
MASTPQLSFKAASAEQTILQGKEKEEPFAQRRSTPGENGFMIVHIEREDTIALSNQEFVDHYQRRSSTMISPLNSPTLLASGCGPSGRRSQKFFDNGCHLQEDLLQEGFSSTMGGLRRE